ncbi:MAG: hypothetical protein QOE03_3528 [Micromonosporaceae bacterium]|jgi:hypothetical protein|nr:hypothetical protein [Micromonosporaceae bacterium]
MNDWTIYARAAGDLSYLAAAIITLMAVLAQNNGRPK